MKQLIVVSQKNEQNRVMFHPTIYWKIYFQKLTGKFQLLTSFTSRLVTVNTN